MEQSIQFQISENNYFVLDNEDFLSFLKILDKNDIREFYVQGHPKFIFQYDWETNRLRANLLPISSMQTLRLQIFAINNEPPEIQEPLLLGAGSIVLIPKKLGAKAKWRKAFAKRKIDILVWFISFILGGGAGIALCKNGTI